MLQIIIASHSKCDCFSCVFCPVCNKLIWHQIDANQSLRFWRRALLLFCEIADRVNNGHRPVQQCKSAERLSPTSVLAWVQQPLSFAANSFFFRLVELFIITQCRGWVLSTVTPDLLGYGFSSYAPPSMCGIHMFSLSSRGFPPGFPLQSENMDLGEPRSLNCSVWVHSLPWPDIPSRISLPCALCVLGQAPAIYDPAPDKQWWKMDRSLLESFPWV